MSNLLTALTVKMMILLSLPGPEQLGASLDPVMLEKAEQIDVVSVSGRFSYAEYRMQRPTRQERLGYPVHTFTPDAIPFGRYDLKRGEMVKKPNCYCGYIIPLGRSAVSVNLLGYQEVVIRGRFTGTWRIAFADDALTALEDNVPLGTVNRSGEHRFKLADLMDGADLSRSRQLVLILNSDKGSARVQEVSFSHAPQTGVDGGRGIWIWRRDGVLGKEEAVLRRLTAQGVKKVYLQVGNDPEVFALFLTRAKREGIEVYALDGSPGYIAAPQELLERIGLVERYNSKNPQARFAGFQIDIEPYLNKDFASRKAYYASAYAGLVQEIKKKYDLPLSVVVPFWFDNVHADGRTLLQRIFENADEVVVMSYRTDPRAVLEISRSALALGEQFGKPVRLGVELGPIPDEQHQELNRCSASSTGAFKLGSSWWCAAGEFLVPGSRISFKYRKEELPSFLKTAVPFASFRGWVLHSYEELPPAHE